MALKGPDPLQFRNQLRWSQATEAEMQVAVAAADSDLQYILQESGATLQTQYRVVQVHASRRRFQAVADTRES